MANFKPFRDHIIANEGNPAHPYLDSKGLITIGPGLNMEGRTPQQTEANFKRLNLEITDQETGQQRPATEAEKMEALNALRVEQQRGPGNRVADEYKNTTQVTLPEAERDRLLDQQIGTRIEAIKKDVGDANWERLSDGQKAAVLDVHYARGSLDGFDSLKRAIKAGDAEEIGKNVDFHGTNPDGSWQYNKERLIANRAAAQGISKEQATRSVEDDLKSGRLGGKDKTSGLTPEEAQALGMTPGEYLAIKQMEWDAQPQDRIGGPQLASANDLNLLTDASPDYGTFSAAPSMNLLEDQPPSGGEGGSELPVPSDPGDGGDEGSEGGDDGGNDGDGIVGVLFTPGGPPEGTPIDLSDDRGDDAVQSGSTDPRVNDMVSLPGSPIDNPARSALLKPVDRWTEGEMKDVLNSAQGDFTGWKAGDPLKDHMYEKVQDWHSHVYGDGEQQFDGGKPVDPQPIVTIPDQPSPHVTADGQDLWQTSANMGKTLANAAQTDGYGNAVKGLQNGLNMLNDANPPPERSPAWGDYTKQEPLREDGDYGPKTDFALKSALADHGADAVDNALTLGRFNTFARDAATSGNADGLDDKTTSLFGEDAGRSLQRSLNKIGGDAVDGWEPLKEDNWIGPKTTDAFNSIMDSVGPDAFSQGFGEEMGLL